MIAGREGASAVSFTRSRRLTRREQFDEVLAQGSARTGRYFVVRGRATAHSAARLGIVVGRRAVPRAVDRNLCKRIVREVFRAQGGTLGALDVVVLCRRPIGTKGERAQAREELTRLFGAMAGERIGAQERRGRPNPAAG